MDKLEALAEQIRTEFDAQTAARDQALARARQLTRHCSQAIRAVHREDETEMQEQLAEARSLANTLRTDLQSYPSLYFAGYTQDALKEFVEANATCALIQNRPLPTLEDLHVEGNTYLNGLAETIGELRRRCLDILRHGYSAEAERLLTAMDDIYAILVTMDYPDAITNGLRRQTDVARSIIERTRGDLTFNLRGEALTNALAELNQKITGQAPSPGPQLSRHSEED